jgi:4-hydroxy-tetrahydrodipicolinate reductase
MAVKLVVSGCCGKMGSRIAALAPPALLAVGLEARGHAAVGRDLGEVVSGKALGVRVTDDAAAALEQGTVLVEFTTPEATMEHLGLAVSLQKAMVIGTTGLSDADRQRIGQAAARIPIVLSPNMSVGVNVLFELVQTAAERLSPSYAVRITETHHLHKKDAPSGTAKRLHELIAAVRSRWNLSTEAPESIREGEVVGDHTVVFSTPFERVELTHRAQTRDVFAVGAIEAAKFAAGQPPGLYDMADVLRQTSDMRHETPGCR